MAALREMGHCLKSLKFVLERSSRCFSLHCSKTDTKLSQIWLRSQKFFGAVFYRQYCNRTVQLSKKSQLFADSITNFKVFLVTADFSRKFCTKTAEKSHDDPSFDEERAENYKKTWKRLMITSGVLVFFTVVGGSVFVFTYGSKKYDDFGKEVKDEFSDMSLVKQYLMRSWNEMFLVVRAVSEPSREKLLPDPLKEPYYQPKYTVVFEISGILVHPDWTFNTGWRFKKRPGLEYFLKALGYPRTELVVYTNEHGWTAAPIVESLDTENAIMYKLFRDTTKYQYKDGAHVKDLSKLNRDLKKVIFIDWDTKAFQLNPENALRVPKWNGDDDDLGLVDLANLIRTIIDNDVQDVRPILQYYSRCDDPLREFRENQRKLREIEQSKFQPKTEEKSLAKSWAGQLFGYRRHS